MKYVCDYCGKYIVTSGDKMPKKWLIIDQTGFVNQNNKKLYRIQPSPVLATPKSFCSMKHLHAATSQLFGKQQSGKISQYRFSNTKKSTETVS